MYHRNLAHEGELALKDTPAVLIQGSRQSGKSTLAKQLIGGQPSAYFTLDDVSTLAFAQRDPQGFIRSLPDRAVLDEVQRVPELFLSIKQAIDEDRRPGRFILTGSARVMDLPAVADSLAGRIAVLTLYPFSQGELRGMRENFVDFLFGSTTPPGFQSEEVLKLWEAVLTGGYPEAIHREEAPRRQRWFEDYLNTILMKDVRELAQVEMLAEMPRLYNHIALRAGGLLNHADLSRDSGLPASTLKRYMTLLERLFLTYSLPPWHTNRISRLVKSPKIYLTDTGLLGHAVGIERIVAGDKPLREAGALLENFVLMELTKQMGWARTYARLHHFRTHSGQEVDFLLEDRRGRLAGIEVKSAQTLGAKDVAGLAFLQENFPDKFQRGVVLYMGDRVVPIGERLIGVPVSALWTKQSGEPNT